MVLILIALALVLVACQSPMRPDTPVTGTAQPKPESNQPTSFPTLPPTDTADLESFERPTNTAIPPTATPQPTPVPATETPQPSPTPEPPKITTLPELVGYWEYNGFITNGGGAIHYVFLFRADGILEMGDSRRAIESGEFKTRADYWFEEGEWRSQLVSGIWRRDNCFLGSGKPLTGRYEIRPDEAGNLQFFRTIDSCVGRTLLSDNDAVLTPIVVEGMDWFIDFETGLPLNPEDPPETGLFVLTGTMLNFDAGGDTPPLVTVRLPTGQIVDVSGPPLADIQIEEGAEVNLSDYDPDYPLRARLVVQQSRNGLTAEEMVVFTELK